MPSQKLNTLLAVDSVACALTVTGLLVKRELFPTKAGSAEPIRLSTADWAAISTGGEALGPPNAAVRIVVFADFQCPACRDFARGPLQGILDEYPKSVEVRFRNWPLPYHPLAADLAVQARCAGRQNRFWAYHDLLFAVQDSVAVIHADSLARRAQVLDILRWRACLADKVVREEIATETALAKSIDAAGTPTVVVNGYKYLGFPDLDELKRAVAEAER